MPPLTETRSFWRPGEEEEQAQLEAEMVFRLPFVTYTLTVQDIGFALLPQTSPMAEISFGDKYHPISICHLSRRTHGGMSCINRKGTGGLAHRIGPMMANLLLLLHSQPAFCSPRIKL